MSRKIYVVGPPGDYINWMQGTRVNTMEEADLVVFTGGEDISPGLYTDPEKKHPRTSNNPDRDNREFQAFNRCIALGKKVLGICRGSQLVCVGNGGRLVQDQPNPKSRHDIITYTGEVLEITSSHHQAMYPFNLEDHQYSILGWTEGMLKHHEDGDKQEMYPPQECEIVLFHEHNCLGIQGHPEWMGAREPTVIWLQELLTKFLDNKIDINENATAEATN